MGEEAKYLDVFPGWLRSLGDDAEAIAAVVGAAGASDAARQFLAGGLNYMFKSIDLVPDGTDHIGFLDDAFVLRVAADLALREDTKGIPAESLKALAALSGHSDTIKAFLGEDFARFEAYVSNLRKGVARGRSVADILSDASTRRDFLSDVSGFSKSYSPPSFSREDKNLVRLKAFLDAKLPK